MMMRVGVGLEWAQPDLQRRDATAYRFIFYDCYVIEVIAFGYTN
jgi:hypothetical protein